MVFERTFFAEKKREGGDRGISRRRFMLSSLCLAASSCLPGRAFASVEKHDSLSFFNTHTGERMQILYSPGVYKGAVSNALEYFLRDFRTGGTHPIDSALLDSLWKIQQVCGKSGPYEVISGYRSPETNEFLRRVTTGVDKNSLHMQGRAIDVRLTGLPTDMLRDLALHFHPGGVGYYPNSNFVHIDTGTKRSW